MTKEGGSEPRAKGSEARYEEDLATIRRILSENEDQPLIEFWAFIGWGGLVLVGTLVHLALSLRLEPGTVAEQTRLALMVWIPTVVVAATQETLAFLKRLNTDSVPFSSRRLKRLMLQAFGVFLVAFGVLLEGLFRGIHPGILVLMGALSMLPYGYATYSPLFIEAFVLIGLGVGMLIAVPASTAWFAAAGFLIGAVFIVSGIHHRMLERRRLG